MCLGTGTRWFRYTEHRLPRTFHGRFSQSFGPYLRARINGSFLRLPLRRFPSPQPALLPRPLASWLVRLRRRDNQRGRSHNGIYAPRRLQQVLITMLFSGMPLGALLGGLLSSMMPVGGVSVLRQRNRAFSSYAVSDQGAPRIHSIPKREEWRCCAWVSPWPGSECRFFLSWRMKLIQPH
jgi:hypothetical protein